MDQGTAFCFGQFQEDTNEALLIARSERNYHDIILSTAIRSNDVYQRQQETLIVWTEPDGVDYALSFQDPEGCSEVWNFILEVQRHMNNDDGLPDPSLTTASIIRSGHLPRPQLGIIGEIEKAMKSLSRTPHLKERICEYIQQEGYIKSLIEVMNTAEDLESLENLHALCSLMQTILMMNDHGMYEHILEDDIFFGVVGMLEYDPDFPAHKANYRQFLHQTSQFHQPIPLRDIAIQRKIHHTYRLQFLKDVVLARALDDSTFNVLNSSIIFNQIDIIQHVQQDHAFLREVVRLFVDEEMLAGEHDISLRREVILLIQQLCIMGKNVQLPARLTLFRTLVDRGILFATQWALSLSDKDQENKSMVSAGGEVLSALIDHDLNGVRTHVLKQEVAIEKERLAGKKGANKAETLLELVCKIVTQCRDLAIQSQVGDALKAWLDVPPNDSPPMAASEVVFFVEFFIPQD
ncbi:hypothetical protein K443DRAFT_654891 [Laccaria amethystina LaAM-08-1]|uniref:Serine/threonine-protein phosphatase 4 regulatory subunit 3-like central domain-containing protein n=1 Tax=Laccaria amethystina LaAM-08-1 TaxID=1095629 RepID=A0A0C9XZJ6_9AGAR|nr:hypothetical protein K443DRAFT_654891 [Laccaria amethystina LaAM-08-1]